MTGNATTRRRFLRGAAATAGLVAAGGEAAAQEGGTLEVALVDYAFEPGTDEPARITPGTTVDFVWETSTHNIVVDSQPDGADWAGHETVESAGFEYSHTFETEGTYEFHCAPHLSLGMEGTIVVSSEPAGGDGGGEGGGGPVVPDAAKTVGVGLFAAFLVTLGLAYSLLKYGGSPDEAGE